MEGEHPCSRNEGGLLDVDHARVQDLFVDLEVVDQTEGADDPVPDKLTFDLSEFDFEEDIVGALVVRDQLRILPRAEGAQLRRGFHKIQCLSLVAGNGQREQFSLRARQVRIRAFVAE